jgi:hypothetical protein
VGGHTLINYCICGVYAVGKPGGGELEAEIANPHFGRRGVPFPVKGAPHVTRRSNVIAAAALATALTLALSSGAQAASCYNIVNTQTGMALETTSSGTVRIAPAGDARRGGVAPRQVRPALAHVAAVMCAARSRLDGDAVPEPCLPVEHKRVDVRRKSLTVVSSTRTL